MKKERIDILLVEKNLCQSRERAKSSILAGLVFADGQRVDKVGDKVDIESNIEVKGDIIPYVSRGGLKLEKALKEFNIDLNQKVCLDVGASTGGFTDCMLQNGAKKVYSIDVGYGQLAWSLRQDERVVCMERTNVRYVTPEQIQEPGNFASIDVSFISLSKVLPAVYNLLVDDGEIMCLIKPQFEAGREQVGKKGVVREPHIHMEVISKVISFSKDLNLYVKDLSFSPIKGPEGNREYLVYLVKNKDLEYKKDMEKLIGNIVEESHKVLE